MARRAIGPNTEALVMAVLTHRPHPEQGFRTCLGVVRATGRAIRHVVERGLFEFPKAFGHAVQTEVVQQIEGRMRPEEFFAGSSEFYTPMNKITASPLISRYFCRLYGAGERHLPARLDSQRLVLSAQRQGR